MCQYCGEADYEEPIKVSKKVRIKELKKENTKLRQENAKLREENGLFRQQVVGQKNMNGILQARVVAAEARFDELKKESS